MRKLQHNRLAVAIAVATLPVLLPTLASAQNTPPANVEEIVVSGFRQSQQAALDLKKSENGFVDAIVASDIAEFPDNNLAEALQRISGVSIMRSGGEGRQITVRGLGPTFATVRINGMDTISTAGGTDAVGGNNRGRGFDFNTFSSDLFSNLKVYKSNAAERPEGSLGATVEMNSAHPFDYRGFVMTASGSMGYNDLSEENSPGASLLVSNKFLDGKFGALFSVSYSERDVRDEGASTVRWSNAVSNRFRTVKGLTVGAGGTAGYTTAPSAPNDFDRVNGWCLDTDANPATACVLQDANRPFAPRIPRYDSYVHAMERTGANLSLQFAPSASTEITYDGFFATFDATRQEIFMEASLNPGVNVTGGVVNDYALVGKTMPYASLSGVRLLSENRFDEMSTDFSQHTLSLEQDIGDRLRITALLGQSESDYQNPIQNTLLMQATSNFTYDFRNYENPVFTFGDTAYTAATWAINSVRQRPQSTLNENNVATLGFEYDLNEIFTLKAGAESREFEFSTDQFALSAGEGANGVNLAAKPTYIVNYDSGLGDGRPWLIPNRELIMADYGLFNAAMVPTYASQYEVTEETTGYYAQVDFSFELGTVPVRGDIGLRRFSTDQSSSGWLNGTLASRSYVTVDHDYSDTLPSLNVTAELVENVLVKAAYSEAISRAGLGSIVPAVAVNVAGTNRTITGANPLLEPTQAESYDLGVEWYFAPESLLGITFFRKEFSNYVQTVRSTVIYSDTGLPPEAAVAACAAAGRPTTECNATNDWAFSAPANGPGGTLKGYEIAYQQPFTFLPEIFNRFGFIGSFADISSDLDYLSPTSDLARGILVIAATKPLVNLSDRTSSATLYYEDEKLSARVSMAKRSGYLTTPIGRDNNIEEGTNATTNVDASIAYTFDEHFKIKLDMLNLTDEPDDQWVGSESEQRLSYYHNTGRQYDLSVQYKF